LCAKYIYLLFVFGLMSETIEFELVRPVNPTGKSFIDYVWGAVGARNRGRAPGAWA